MMQDEGVGWLVSFFLVERPSNMLMCLRDGSEKTVGLAATPRQKLQIKLDVAPSQSTSSALPSYISGVHCFG